MNKQLLIVSLLVFILDQSAATCVGCLSLDPLTFNKVVTKFESVLVKFDVAFAYGQDHEAFSAFAAEIQNSTLTPFSTKELIIASVGIKDYGDKENADLGKRYGITGDVFPVIKLFNGGSLKNPVDFKECKFADKICD